MSIHFSSSTLICTCAQPPPPLPSRSLFCGGTHLCEHKLGHNDGNATLVLMQFLQVVVVVPDCSVIINTRMGRQWSSDQAEKLGS